MTDLFNHKIEVKKNKGVDLANMPSNSLRTMRVKPVVVKVEVEEKPVEVAEIVESEITESVEIIEETAEVESTPEVIVEKKPVKRKPRAKKVDEEK